MWRSGTCAANEAQRKSLVATIFLLNAKTAPISDAGVNKWAWGSGVWARLRSELNSKTCIYCSTVSYARRQAPLNSGPVLQAVGPQQLIERSCHRLSKTFPRLVPAPPLLIRQPAQTVPTETMRQCDPGQLKPWPAGRRSADRPGDRTEACPWPRPQPEARRLRPTVAGHTVPSDSRERRRRGRGQEEEREPAARVRESLRKREPGVRGRENKSR